MNYPTTRTLKDGREADLFSWVRGDDGLWYVEPSSTATKRARSHKGGTKTIEEIKGIAAREVADYREGGVVALDQFRYYE